MFWIDEAQNLKWWSSHTSWQTRENREAILMISLAGIQLDVSGRILVKRIQRIIYECLLKSNLKLVSSDSRRIREGFRRLCSYNFRLVTWHRPVYVGVSWLCEGGGGVACFGEGGGGVSQTLFCLLWNRDCFFGWFNLLSSLE